MNEQEDKTSKTEEVVANRLYFNVWMLNVSDGEVLVVGRPYHLRASLTPPENDQTQYAVDHVDVVVICPHFEINSLRESLPIPPKSDSVVGFCLTPKIAGKLVIRVLLQVKGQTIHDSETAFEVRQN